VLKLALATGPLLKVSATFWNARKFAGLKTTVLPCSWRGASGFSGRVSYFFQWHPNAFKAL
jgi:hypothetical protein